jgi:hypothetical protein
MTSPVSPEERVLQRLRFAGFALLALGALGCEVDRRVMRIRQRATLWSWHFSGELERPASLVRDLGLMLLESTGSRHPSR